MNSGPMPAIEDVQKIQMKTLDQFGEAFLKRSVDYFNYFEPIGIQEQAEQRRNFEDLIAPRLPKVLASRDDQWQSTS